VAALYGEPVVRYVETNSTKNFFSKNRGSVASQADMQRIPAQVTAIKKSRIVILGFGTARQEHGP
jgi:hypothetical protein